LLGARPDRYREDRGADPGTENAIHDRHRYAQHAASGTRLRFYFVLLHGPAHRGWLYDEDFHKSKREADGRLHHWEIWMILLNAAAYDVAIFMNSNSEEHNGDTET